MLMSKQKSQEHFSKCKPTHARTHIHIHMHIHMHMHMHMHTYTYTYTHTHTHTHTHTDIIPNECCENTKAISLNLQPYNPSEGLSFVVGEFVVPARRVTIVIKPSSTVSGNAQITFRLTDGPAGVGNQALSTVIVNVLGACFALVCMEVCDSMCPCAVCVVCSCTYVCVYV
jgi:hypothetical protein